jgi:NAD(P) transhydrogenase subunit alpha
MPSDLELSLYVFMLATFVGLEIIRKVSPLLHTPLMSITNAISGICVVGAILVTESAGGSTLGRVLGFIAVTASVINIVSGFLITDRMLKMFKKREDPKGPGKR